MLGPSPTKTASISSSKRRLTVSRRKVILPAHKAIKALQETNTTKDIDLQTMPNLTETTNWLEVVARELPYGVEWRNRYAKNTILSLVPSELTSIPQVNDQLSGKSATNLMFKMSPALAVVDQLNNHYEVQIFTNPNAESQVMHAYNVSRILSAFNVPNVHLCQHVFADPVRGHIYAISEHTLPCVRLGDYIDHYQASMDAIPLTQRDLETALSDIFGLFAKYDYNEPISKERPLSLWHGTDVNAHSFYVRHDAEGQPRLYLHSFYYATVKYWQENKQLEYRRRGDREGDNELIAFLLQVCEIAKLIGCQELVAKITAISVSDLFKLRYQQLLERLTLK